MTVLANAYVIVLFFGGIIGVLAAIVCGCLTAADDLRWDVYWANVGLGIAGLFFWPVLLPAAMVYAMVRAFKFYVKKEGRL